MNNLASLGIAKIWQLDNHCFSIEWSDGVIQKFRLSDIQKNCPCAGCYDVEHHSRLPGAPSVQEDVRALSLKNVGQYALQIRFTSGCSAGIYSFAFLKSLGGKSE